MYMTPTLFYVRIAETKGWGDAGASHPFAVSWERRVKEREETES
jgi:hypothetical protein